MEIRCYPLDCIDKFMDTNLNFTIDQEEQLNIDFNLINVMSVEKCEDYKLFDRITHCNEYISKVYPKKCQSTLLKCASFDIDQKKQNNEKTKRRSILNENDLNKKSDNLLTLSKRRYSGDSFINCKKYVANKSVSNKNKRNISDIDNVVL